MRCRECNVDLPDNYTACPLCGAKPFDDPLLIQGIRTAEYPKAQPKPFKRNPFTVFVIVWLGLSAISFLLLKLNIIEAYVSASVFCLIPCIWTLFVRPFLIKQLYHGNFVIMNLFPFALICTVFDKLMNGNFEQSLLTYLPICSLAVFAVLLILVIAKPKKNKRAASYPVLMMPVGIVAAVTLGITRNTVPYLWCAVVALCVIILAILLVTKPNETKQELKAKFSIQ